METILNCVVHRIVNTIWDLVTKVISRGMDPSQSITIKGKVILDKFFFIIRAIISWYKNEYCVYTLYVFKDQVGNKRKLGYKKLVKEFYHKDHSMATMKIM